MKTLAALSFLAAASLMQATVITFTADTTGPKPNGFQSVDSNQVSFSDTIGADLQIGDYGVQSHGNALAVFGDDPSALLMNFTVSLNAMSLDFGNDDPAFTNPGDLAVLTLFSGITQVGQVTVVMNRDDIMNQTISYSGAAFNNAIFQYRNASNTAPINLIEVVDNITFGAAVPEPASLGLMGAGLSALAFFARRRKA